MAKQKIETKAKVIPIVDHLKCKYHEKLKMPGHIWCDHMYIRMITPDDKMRCIYFSEL